MRPIRKPKTRRDRRYRRHRRVRKKIRGTAARPRLTVFRSLKHMYAQLIDDDQGRTLVGVSDVSDGVEVEGDGKVARAFAVGKLLGRRASEAGVEKIVFDRSGYPYHGRVKALADGVRKGGLEF